MTRETYEEILSALDRPTDFRGVCLDNERAERFTRAMKQMGPDGFAALAAAVDAERARRTPAE